VETGEKQFWLRMGMTKERPYVEKTVAMFTGLFIKANLFESAPSALSALIVRYVGTVKSPPARYVIDPVTYVFGVESEMHDGFGDDSALCHWRLLTKDDAARKLRQDYHIPETQEIPRNLMRDADTHGNIDPGSDRKVEALVLTRSYAHLADKIFADSIRRKVGLRALGQADFGVDNGVLDDFVGKVIDYQQGTLKRCFEGVKYQELGETLPGPAYILSPYFYIKSDESLEFMTSIWHSFDAHQVANGAAVTMVSKSYFMNSWREIACALSHLEAKTVMIWIPELQEDLATQDELVAFGQFVHTLASSNRLVINFYGGGFSMSLLSYGLAGLMNGPGYGLQRSAIPVKGGAPAASFYIPTLGVRSGVLGALQVMMSNPLIGSKQDFLDHVCSCPICRTAMSKSADDDYATAFWNYYGELVPSKTPGSNRLVPTRDATDRNAFHFLLARLLEFRAERQYSPAGSLQQLRTYRKSWPGRSGEHLDTWVRALVALENGE